MRLLVVAPTTGSAQALLENTDTASLGYTDVYYAAGLAEARAALAATGADVVICRMQHGTDDALAFAAYMAEQQPWPLFLLATAVHSFAVAAAAVTFGCFALLPLPCTGEELAATLARAAQRATERRQERQLQEMGREFRRQAASIAGNAVRFKLLGGINTREIQALEQLGSLPAMGRPGYLVLLRILRWWPDADEWDSQLLSVALRNMLHEIFSPSGVRIMLTVMDTNTFCLLLQPREADAVVKPEHIAHQLQFLYNVCEQYIRCSTACYLHGPLVLGIIEKAWPTLVQADLDNVALKPGVHRPGHEKTDAYAYSLPGTRQWAALLREGRGAEVAQQAFALLDAMVAEGQMGAAALNHFYQDFLQALYQAAGAGGSVMQQMFHSPQELELYRNGMRSVDNMKALIQHAANRAHLLGTPRQTRVVDLASAYIHEHIDEEIRREELAEYVHLNPDYLTRIFKRETGLTLKEYIIHQKMEHARDLLLSTDLSVSAVAAGVGYVGFSHFSYTYKKIMGRTPMQERTDAQKEGKRS